MSKREKNSKTTANDDDDDDDKIDDDRNNSQNIISAHIHYQIDLLNQSQKKYLLLQKMHVNSKNDLFFGVYKPEIQPQGEKIQCFAIKAYLYENDNNNNNDQKKCVDNDLHITSLFFHEPSIIHYHDEFEAPYKNKVHKFAVMTYYEKGSLMEAAHKIRDKEIILESFPPEDIRQIAHQSLKILKLLKDKKIVHNGIKLENFLLKSRNPIVITLTGFEYAESIEENLSTNPGDDPYTKAPEVLMHEPHGYASDMWALGILLYVLLAKETPFLLQPFQEENDCLENIKNETLEKKQIQDVQFQLISRMLEMDPNNRITVEEALESKWFENITEIDPRQFSDLSLSTKQKTSVYGIFLNTFNDLND